jgi:GR25 family glycosyltransferase involved in LPS biosynthesis|tara:strand:+ start:20 stop:757 length:738 start_codon:yes stop_codon:yes gene_type:complete
MKHIWINIDNNEKRKTFMYKQFNENNIENIRVSAITPLMFDKVLHNNHTRPLTCKYPDCITCDYEFACLCSHIKAMQECLKYEDEYFVIMEDDISLPFLIDYNKLINATEKKFDILQLLILYNNTIESLNNVFKEKNILFIKWQYLLPSTGMYIISRQSAEKLVTLYFNENKYDFTKFDGQIVADVLLYQSVNTICSTIPYCYPNIDMGSEIHPEHLLSHQKAVDSIKKVINEYKKYPFVLKKII